MEKKNESSLNKKRKRTNSKSKTIQIRTIKELHDYSKFLFLTGKYNNYDALERNVIKIYDLDEEINEKYLLLLLEYYKKNKEVIDKDTKNNLSNKIANNFYTYIFTISYKSRIKIYNNNNFFKKGEIFENEEKFFYTNSMKYVFSELIKQLLLLENSKNHHDDYKKIIDNYQIPKAKRKRLIPSNFGNEEYRYTIYITHITSLIDLNKNFKEQHKDEYVEFIIIALVTFKNYLLLDAEYYKEECIEYIIFCIESIILYSKNMDIMKANILENLSKCAAFLFETIDKKKKKLALIEENIVNKNFDIEKINYNTQIEIVYMNNTYTFKVSDFFFSGLKNRKAILECIKTNKNHSFSYYQNNKKILDSEELETHYDNYFKAILTSNINKNYINELEGIGEYNFILNEEKFLNEINLSYVIMPINTLSGLTSKNFYTVYISNSIDYCHVEKILPQLGGKLVTKLHEIINHIYRLIIHINDYEIPFDTPPKIFKKDALNNKENIKPLKDG